MIEVNRSAKLGGTRAFFRSGREILFYHGAAKKIWSWLPETI